MIPAIARSIPIALPVNTAVSAADTRVREPASTQPRGPGVLQVALSMNDDLAMKMSAHRMRRGEATPDAPATSPWVERVLDEEGPRKVADVKATLRGQRNPSPGDVRLLLATLFPDPSDQVAVLRALLDDETLEELHEVLNRTLEQMLAEQTADGSRKRVAAGVNVAITARLAAQGASLSAVLLRDCYRDFLDRNADPITQYELWVDVFGYGQRQAVVDFIGRGLIVDLYSLDPSCSVDEFGPVLRAVSKLRALRAADAVIARDFWDARLMARLGVAEAAFLKSILRIVREGKGWSDLFDVLLSRTALLCTLEDSMLLAQRFRRALRGFPNQLWATPGKLDTALAELEELVDATLARETLAASSAIRRSVRA